MHPNQIRKGIAIVALLSLSTELFAQTSQYATTQYAYDRQGNLTQVTDQRGLMTTFSYDVLDRRTQGQAPTSPAARADHRVHIRRSGPRLTGDRPTQPWCGLHH